MQKFLLSFLTLLFITTNSFGFNELDKTLSSYYKQNNIQESTNKVDQYTLLRRLYLDLAGRIPNTEEIKSFITEKNPNKKEILIDKLLYSEDYVNNFYNFFADLYRIRPERLSDNIQLRGYPYMEYIRDFLRSDKPYDLLTQELLSSEGRPFENPATSYVLRDDGMTFDNIALTTQIFIGKSTSCQICHNDPFSDKTQKQFYELASFFDNDNRENRKDYRDILKKVDEEIKSITKTDRIDNNIRQLMGSNLLNVKSNPNKTIKYPADYKYDNAKPGEIAVPVSLDGKIRDIKENKRKEIAKWFIAQPDFSCAITNRLWQQIIGNNLFYPQIVSDFNINESKHKEIISFLGSYFKEHSYSLKSYIRLIVSSDFYERNSYTGKLEDYKFQGPIVKRLSAHQIWDSIISLILTDPNYSRISFNEYNDLVAIDWENEVSGAQLLKKVSDIRDYENKLNNNFLKYKGIELVRSCYNLRGNNGFVGLFLKEFGASERQLLDTSRDTGTVTQLLTLMNSPLMEVLTDKKSQIMKSNNKDIIFASIMTRPVGILERSTIEKLHNNDLIWVLLNSTEFLFKK